MAEMTKKPHFQPHQVVLVAFGGVEPLDVTGPAGVFGKAADMRPGAYALSIASSDGGTVRAANGIAFADTVALADLPATADTILVAGGDEVALMGAIQSGLPAWLASRAGAPRLGSICTGAFLLAAAGLLEGRRATTHWRAADQLRALFPNVRVEPEPIYVHDGVYTSAGVTAGIDLALALVAADHGHDLANAIARELVVYARRAGGQSQYSRTLAAQTSAGGKLAALISSVLDTLEASHTGPELAARAGMSERTFARQFKKETGMTPAHFVMRARVEHALMLLETTALPIDQIAARVGMGSIDSLQRAFRTLGLGAPSIHRRHFGVAEPRG